MKMQGRNLGRALIFSFIFLNLVIPLAETQDFKFGQSLAKVDLKKLKNKDNQITVFLQSEARCNFGDLDVISLDLKKLGTDAQLQVTAEILGSENSQVFYGTAEGKGVNAGYTIALPNFDKPTVLGLYLCMGSKTGEKFPCSKKQLQSYSELLSPYKIDIAQATKDSEFLRAVAEPKITRSAVKDRIYFFRHLVIFNGKAYFNEKPMTSEKYQELIADLKQGSADVSDYDALSTTLAKYGSTLASEPLSLKKNRIFLTLPFYDKKKCNG